MIKRMAIGGVIGATLMLATAGPAAAFHWFSGFPVTNYSQTSTLNSTVTATQTLTNTGQ